MIGNDVIDLALARKESHWQRKGWLPKLFNVTEQAIILNSDNPEIMVWTLWSMKESAYKIYNRETRLRAFNPLRFVCENPVFSEGFFWGKIEMDGNSYVSKTAISSDYIHSFAVENPINLKNINYCFLSNYQKLPVLKDQYNVPYLKKEFGQEMMPVSVSSHGQFFSCVAIDNLLVEFMDPEPRLQL